MTRHTTHFDDCGCKSDRYERRIKALREALIEIAARTYEEGTESRANAALADDDRESETTR